MYENFVNILLELRNPNRLSKNELAKMKLLPFKNKKLKHCV